MFILFLAGKIEGFFTSCKLTVVPNFVVMVKILNLEVSTLLSTRELISECESLTFICPSQSLDLDLSNNTFHFCNNLLGVQSTLHVLS